MVLHLFMNFPQFFVIHIVKGFSVVSEADFFLPLPCFFHDPVTTGNLISVPLPFLNRACTSGNSLFIYSWSLDWRILNITLVACEMNAIVWQFEQFWHCPSLKLEWILTFSSPMATAEFSKFSGILSAALSQHHLLGSELAQVGFHHLH